MKIFDQAILKLTAFYTFILLVICVGFSTVIYNVTTAELNRPRPVVMGIKSSGDIEMIINQRNEQVRAELLERLIVINIFVVLLGALASYFLARFTLRPIHEAYDEQARFVSDSSHELRTPLTAVLMENEVILRDKSATKEDLTMQIKSNIEEVKKLQSLTNYLLKLARDEKIQLQNIMITPVIDDVIASLSPVAQAKNIEISQKISTKAIYAEETALSSILNILVENAIKYSPENSKIKIIADKNKISVIDEGPGITESDLPHIFKRFYRAEKSRTSDGYGLGLSLAEKLARQIRAKVTVANNPKKGATFSVLFQPHK